jgi:phosphonoacetate hydrolase
MYLSTSDYVQHKAAPGSPAANAFYAALDGVLARLAAAGANVALTADHGMKPKHGPDGAPCVVYLQTLLDETLGPDAARVILPITDPYVAHHGSLGGYAAVYLRDGGDAARAAARLRAQAGVEEVLSRDEACARVALPPDRTGDLVALADPGHALGSTPERHDLSRLGAPLRSHGGRHEQTVPLLANLPCPPGGEARDWRNFDAFHLVLNGAGRGE